MENVYLHISPEGKPKRSSDVQRGHYSKGSARLPVSVMGCQGGAQRIPGPAPLSYIFTGSALHILHLHHCPSHFPGPHRAPDHLIPLSAPEQSFYNKALLLSLM